MTSVVRMTGVSVRRGTTWLLRDVDITIAEGERWAVMGPNGAGKTTLMLLASGRLFPSAGDVELLGETMGAVDMAELKPRIGWASSSMLVDIPPTESVVDVVMTGAWAVSGRWREHYDDADRLRALDLLAQWGMGTLSDRTFGTLSEGERKRALIARALMSDPELVLLDEPGAGLDLGGREDLVERMARLAADPDAPTQMVVTHHVEEIPAGFTHLLLLNSGRVVAAGEVAPTMTDENLSRAFDMPIAVRHDDGRWFAPESRPRVTGSMEPFTLALLAAAGFVAGFINAAVGSGTLITYPALLAVGIAPVAANGTNTAGLSPGSFASAWAYRAELRDRMGGLARPLVASVVGAAIGATLVVALPSRVFVAVVPWLVGTATVLVAVQPVLARTVREHRRGGTHSVWPWTGLIGIYGGYFGAAQGVMLMAALGLVYDPDTQRSNAAKNILAAAANVTAALVFAVSGAVVWLAALAVAVGSIPGGYVGGRVARRLPGQVLRGLVVLIGVGATLYLVLRR